MAKKFWALCAIMILSVNLSYAVEVNTNVKAPPDPPKLIKDPTTGIELVYVKGGCYQMGDIFYEERIAKEKKKDPDNIFERPEERPVHEVCVDDFYIGKYEVT